MEEVELIFSDVTMREAEGIYDNIVCLMAKEPVLIHEWMLKTDLEIIFSTGNMCQFVLHFFSNRDVWIMEYQSSGERKVLYNPDIGVLSEWCQANGWEMPSPYFSLVDSDMVFWKHFWETNLVKSDYLCKKIGIDKDRD
ncbi:MAG: hypothetical protein ACOC5T_06820 [Elusimicrobiota bacterium]